MVRFLVCSAVVFSCVFFLKQEVSAKIFRNSYVSFELPNDWKCKLEDTTWICINKKENKLKKTALIILTAKEKGPSDSFEIFESYLKTPRLNKGKPSTVMYVNNRTINNHRWIDSLHQRSEAPSFWTRYVATIHGGLSILVTYSSHVKFYTKYSADFIASVQSLKLNTDAIRLAENADRREIHEQLGTPVNSLISSHLGAPPGEPQQRSKRLLTAKNLGIFFFVLAAIVLGFILLFKKTKKRR